MVKFISKNIGFKMKKIIFVLWEEMMIWLKFLDLDYQLGRNWRNYYQIKKINPIVSLKDKLKGEVLFVYDLREKN